MSKADLEFLESHPWWIVALHETKGTYLFRFTGNASGRIKGSGWRSSIGEAIADGRKALGR